MRTRQVPIIGVVLCFAASFIPTFNFSAGSKVPDKPNSNIDRNYNTAVEASKAGYYKEANAILFKTWAAYNASVKAGTPPDYQTTEIMIVDLLRFTAGQSGQIKKAIVYAKYLLRKFSQVGEQFVRNLKGAINAYELELEAQKQLRDTNKYDTVEFANKMMELEKYSSCHSTKHPKLQWDVFCRIDDRKRNPLLLLSPVREEILSSDPVLLLLHNLVTPREVEIFKEESKPKLRFADYDLPGEGGTRESTRVVDYRKAGVAWLYQDPVSRFTRRLSAILGLNAWGDGAESYQVCHYNVGGHFIPHFDAPIDDDYQPSKYAGANAYDSFMGKRLATLMIYLNNVEDGGATTFPLIDISVKPSYRSGLFWYNLHRNDSTIFKTIHAGCPVLKGEKWIVNKWFRVSGQVFKRPCPLDRTLVNYNVDISSDIQ